MQAQISIRQQVCPDHATHAPGLVRSHGRAYPRFICSVCKKTWVFNSNSTLYRLRHSAKEVEAALSLLSQGESLRNVAKILGVSPSTIQRWKNRDRKIKRSIHF